MKKIMLIDGSPRKNMNTAAMLDSFGKGVKSVSDDIEVRHIHLYENTPVDWVGLDPSNIILKWIL